MRVTFINVRKIFVLLLMSFVITFSFSTIALASSLDGIGAEVDEGQTDTSVEETTVTEESAPQVAPSNTVTTEEGTGNQGTRAGAVSDLLGGISVDSESASKANTLMSPVIQGANFVFALGLLCVSLFIFFITLLDLVYIGVPPLRKYLNPEQGSSNQGGFGGGFAGGGAFGSPYAGSMGGMGGMGGGQAQTSKNPFLSRWISDEALSAVSSLEGSRTGGGGGSFNHFSSFGGAQQQEPPKMKSVIFSYLKKRIIFLVMFGICSVLFSTLIFTEIGINLGGWVLDKLTGVKDSIG